MCRLCLKEYDRQKRLKNLELQRANGRLRSKKRFSNPEVRKRQNLLLDPFKKKAWYALHQAVYSGKIIKPNHCEECGQEKEVRKLHGHHSDYSQPLMVRWLCAVCHDAVHRNSLRAAKVK